jgi:hypothetical protein
LGPIGLELGGIWRGGVLDFDVAFDGDVAEFEKGEGFLASLSGLERCIKRPSFGVGRAEVFADNPTFCFVRVALLCPLPQGFPNLVVSVDHRFKKKWVDCGIISLFERKRKRYAQTNPKPTG